MREFGTLQRLVVQLKAKHQINLVLVVFNIVILVVKKQKIK